MKTLFTACIAALALGGVAMAAETSGSAANQNKDMMQVQQKLKSEGLYTGPVDGKEGPKTEQALKEFQQKNGLPQTGQLDQQTESKLGLSESSGASSGSSMAPTGSSNHHGTSGNGTNGSSSSGMEKK
jgi:peptidoglycan hydrolase-like protein with peptidoglycan-binding domain